MRNPPSAWAFDQPREMKSVRAAQAEGRDKATPSRTRNSAGCACCARHLGRHHSPPVSHSPAGAAPLGFRHRSALPPLSLLGPSGNSRSISPSPVRVRSSLGNQIKPVPRTLVNLAILPLLSSCPSFHLGTFSFFFFFSADGTTNLGTSAKDNERTETGGRCREKLIERHY